MFKENEIIAANPGNEYMHHKNLKDIPGIIKYGMVQQTSNYVGHYFVNNDIIIWKSDTYCGSRFSVFDFKSKYWGEHVSCISFAVEKSKFKLDELMPKLEILYDAGLI